MSRRIPCRPLLILVALFLAALGLGPAEAVDGTPTRFREVSRLPLAGGPEVSNAGVDHSGWLILNPTTRRGYQVFETSMAGRLRTVVQSFDLDTLAPRRRATLEGVPITAGVADVATVSATAQAGEIVHAVDQEQGRVYLALSDPAPAGMVAGVGSPPDAQRPLDRFVAIDEAAFDRGDAAFALSFREPPEQVRLHSYWVVGMAVPRPGDLLVLFASPQPGGQANPVPVFDHTLVQWTVAGAPVADWERRLDVCTRAPLASAGGVGQGNSQWGLLVTADAVYTGCQEREGSGAVVRVALGIDGVPPLVGGQQLHVLGQRISDVLVDDGNDRLLVRSFGGGTRLWVFDTASRSFTGAITVKGSDDYPYSAALGVHPATGRLYALVPDHEVFGLPVQGGLHYSDPPAALTNELPELAYPALFRIQVDPLTRRFFVRRGHPAQRNTVVYPNIQSDTPTPVEPFYRVFGDRVKSPR